LIKTAVISFRSAIYGT